MYSGMDWVIERQNPAYATGGSLSKNLEFEAHNNIHKKCFLATEGAGLNVC